MRMIDRIEFFHVSNQEEADTKVFLSAKVAQEMGCDDAVMYTAASDVAILALYYASKLSINIFVQIGTGSNIRIVDTHTPSWSEEILDSLPSPHAISGCDSVSALHGFGKVKWLTTV